MLNLKLRFCQCGNKEIAKLNIFFHIGHLQRIQGSLNWFSGGVLQGFVWNSEEENNNFQLKDFQDDKSKWLDPNLSTLGNPANSYTSKGAHPVIYDYVWYRPSNEKTISVESYQVIAWNTSGTQCHGWNQNSWNVHPWNLYPGVYFTPEQLKLTPLELLSLQVPHLTTGGEKDVSLSSHEGVSVTLSLA